MKVDFKKELKELYNPKAGAFSLVKVPKLQYLMVDGQGDPNKVIEYQEAVEASSIPPFCQIYQGTKTFVLTRSFMKIGKTQRVKPSQSDNLHKELYNQQKLPQ